MRTQKWILTIFQMVESNRQNKWLRENRSRVVFWTPRGAIFLILNKPPFKQLNPVLKELNIELEPSYGMPLTKK